jgi:ParB family chromosome partitioning protein
LTTPKLTLHPLCEIIPPCTDKEFEELKEDIDKNGLQVPIKTFEAKILDGRSRYKACTELGKEPKTEIFAGTSNDALAYVIGMNVKRRHLSASQRALIVARLVTSKLGGDRSVKLPTEITQEDVAKLAGVAVKTVTDAMKVLGRPDLADKVLKGELAVAKAAKQVREEEKDDDAGDDPPAFDACTAVDAYYKAEQSLLNALVALSNASGLIHARDSAGKTCDLIVKTLTSLEPKKAAA